MADTAILTLTDFDRIRQNAYLPSIEQFHNTKKVDQQQKDAHDSKSRTLKERIKSYDKAHPNQQPLLTFNPPKNDETNSEMEKIRDKNDDCIREMTKLFQFAKTATIRDRQIEEQKQMSELYKHKESRLNTMMEIERLKEIQLQEQREISRKTQQREGALVVIDQIREKDRERLKKKEILERERLLMLRQMKELQDDEIRRNEQKRIRNEQLAKEMAHTNKVAALSKEKKKIEDKDLELRILKYNIEKAKREEEELREKKRLQEEKEREVQRLREKQERAQDKQAEMDAVRAKLAYEETERQARLKEREEMRIRQEKVEELIRENDKALKEKERKLYEEALREKEMFERVMKKHQEDAERDRRIDEEKKKMRYENKEHLERMIREKEEIAKGNKVDVLNEGTKLQQNKDLWRQRMEKFRQEKINELRALNVKQKYIVDLEKYKIK